MFPAVTGIVAVFEPLWVSDTGRQLSKTQLSDAAAHKRQRSRLEALQGKVGSLIRLNLSCVVHEAAAGELHLLNSTRNGCLPRCCSQIWASFPPWIVRALCCSL